MIQCAPKKIFSLIATAALTAQALGLLSIPASAGPINLGPKGGGPRARVQPVALPDLTSKSPLSASGAVSPTGATLANPHAEATVRTEAAATVEVPAADLSAPAETLATPPAAEAIAPPVVSGLPGAPADDSQQVHALMRQLEEAASLAAAGADLGARFDASVAAPPAQVDPTALNDSAAPSPLENGLGRLIKELRELGLPPVKHEFVEASRNPTLPAVLLGSPSLGKLATTLAGAKEWPEHVLLAIDPSWTYEKPDETTPGLRQVYVRKGLLFRDNQAVIVTYEKPPLVGVTGHYANLFDNGYTQEEVYPKFSDLSIPAVNSASIEESTNDKVLVQLLLEKLLRKDPALRRTGLRVLPSLAFLNPDHFLLTAPLRAEFSGARQVRVVPTPPTAQEIARLIAETLPVTRRKKVLVTKPSGPKIHSGIGMKFHRRADQEEIALHNMELSLDDEHVGVRGAMINQMRAKMPLYMRFYDHYKGHGPYALFNLKKVSFEVLSPGDEGYGDPKYKKDWNLRVVGVGSAPDNITTVMRGHHLVRIAKWGKPTNADRLSEVNDAALTFRFEDWLEAVQKQYRLLTTPGEVDRLLSEFDEIIRQTFLGLWGVEKKLLTPGRDSLTALTVKIGVDLMMQVRRDPAGKRILEKYMIEINDLDTVQSKSPILYPELAGLEDRDFVMILRDLARNAAHPR